MRKSITFLLGMIMHIVLCQNITAQAINRLQISAPSSIAGSYDIVAGAFGINIIDPLTGELLLIEDDTEPTSDGCTPVVNDLSGYIAFVDRGSCAYIDKAKHAEGAGAIAMLVCNNVEGDPAFVMGGDAPEITIPIAMLTYEDCQTLRLELEIGIEVILDYYEAPCVPGCASFDFPQNTVWGQNGEGTFTCGLGDWTVEAVSDETSVWKWDADTQPVGQSGAPMPLDSETNCNGAAQMDFCDYNFKSGQPSTSVFFASNLVSPTIDLTDVSTPVLHFTHYLCTLSQNQEIAFMTYSRDGGNTWLDTVPILTDNYISTGGPNGPFETDTVKLHFCGEEIGNTDQFKVKFIANGNFYFWTLDDVYITDEAILDVKSDEGWYAGAANFKTPASQIDKVPFMVGINNTGNVELINANYTATVTKDGADLYSINHDIGVIPKCTDLNDLIAPDFWEMEPEPGEYQITYTLDAANISDDPDLENNTVSSTFVITENTFSKLRSEEEVDAAGGYAQYMNGLGQNANYVTYANGYYITNGIGLAPSQLTTGFGTDIYTDFGITTLTGEVRQWQMDSNGNGLVDLETETQLIAQGQVFLDPSNPINLRKIEIDLEVISNFVQEGQYLAVIHVAPLQTPSEETFMAPLSSGFVDGDRGNKDYNFSPTHFAFTQLEGGLGRPASLSDFNGLNNTAENQNSRVLLPDSNLSWYIDMELSPVLGNTAERNPIIDISLYPNPTTNSFSLDVKLMEVSKTVRLDIISCKGQRVASHHFTHIKDNMLEINTADLTSGVYLLNIFTDSGVTSERLLIQK